MSLSASMWTSVSGLLGHGKKMNTIGNNIANISTVGFKGQRMDFADFVYQDTHSLSGPTQTGFGVQVGTLMGNFSQGAFETTTESTDLAINGRGFFQVQAVGSDEAFYTRAGNFRFDKEGYLKDPNGFALQGWRVDNSGGVTQAAGGNAAAVNAAAGSTSAIKGSGVPTDIKLDTWNVFPQQTTKMDFRINLPKDGTDKAKNPENPFAAMFNIWDGTQPPKNSDTPAIAQTSFSEQTTMQIYDEAGVKHTVTVYFDHVSPNDYEGGVDGGSMWEYIVTMDPAEDKRQYWDETTGEMANVNTTKMGGMLMSGTMNFSASGDLVNQSAYTWGGSVNPEDNPDDFTQRPDPAGGSAQKDVLNLDPTDMGSWRPAAVSNNGYPMVVPNFSGLVDAQNPGTENGAKYNTEINFGIKASNFANPWKNDGSLKTLNVASYIYNTDYVSTDPTSGPEYILLNENYKTDTNDKWKISTGRYDINSIGATWKWEGPVTPALGGAELFAAIQANATNTTTTPPVDNRIPTADSGSYLQTIELYNIETISIKAGGIDSTAKPQIPSANVTIDLVTGKVTDADGNEAADNYGIDLTATNPTAEIHANVLAKAIKDAVAGANPTNLNLYTATSPSNANELAGFNEPASIEAHASTNLDGAFTSANSQDGYGFGDLTSWNVGQDGILHGVYSNGVTLPLWQLTMYDFTNTQGLRREGNNLFSQTRESGDPKSGPAGAAGLGTINGYSLEQSNVDMSTEFVYMITTQRGYQANSKLITTTDTMLETVINMKR